MVIFRFVLNVQCRLKNNPENLKFYLLLVLPEIINNEENSRLWNTLKKFIHHIMYAYVHNSLCTK